MSIPAQHAVRPAQQHPEHLQHPPIRLYPQRAMRVYLAGPDVFDRDSGRTFAQLSQLAHSLGLSPIVPMEGWGDVEPPSSHALRGVRWPPEGAEDAPSSNASRHTLPRDEAPSSNASRHTLPPEGAGAGPADPRRASAQRIFSANLARLDSADGVLANLRDFRGSEPDSGTVFEVGYAFARGIPVVAYGVPPACYANRVGLRQACERDELGVLREVGTGCQVEDFGQRLNLMLACAVGIEPDAGAAMARLAQHLGAGSFFARAKKSHPKVALGI